MAMNNVNITGFLWELNELMYGKQLAQHLVNIIVEIIR